MKIGIVTDSTSDLPQYLVDQHGIHVVPAVLILEGREYVDGVDITREEFYNRLPALQSAPTTAAPSLGDFTIPYEKLLANGCDHIISIHMSSKLTAILNVARKAAEEFPGKVTCVDSESMSLGLGFQVLAAVEEADNASEGELGLQSVLEAIELTRKKLKVYAALDTMEYVKRSGRVPGMVATLGGILSIRPVIEVVNGEVKPIGAVRTTKQADEKILSLLMEKGELSRLAILHTNAEARAKNLLNELMNRARKSVPRDILFVNVTSVIGTHVGPNGLGFAAVRK